MNFNKYADGLIPCIVQDATTQVVLMLGFMNQEAFDATKATHKVTFYSRTKQRLWMKGEESGNVLNVVSIAVDCDEDTILIKANPAGVVCHTGADTCFNETNQHPSFFHQLEKVVEDRKNNLSDTSYTASLLKKGINKVAQKVGEEAVELVIEAKDNNEALFLNEAADLMYHYIVLLQAKGYNLQQVEDVLKQRHKK